MRQDNRGVSLIEILVAITVLAVCALPLFRSMIFSAQMNVKSRRLLTATNAAETVMEELKADGMNKFIQKNAGSDEIDEIQYIEDDGERIGYSFVYPEYEIDSRKFRVKVEVKPYKNSDAGNDYNTKEIANIYRMNLATDAVYTESLRYAQEDFMKAVADDTLKLEQKQEVLDNLDIQYDYDIRAEGSSQRVEQTITYSYQGMELGKHEEQIFTSTKGMGDLYNLYLFFEPISRCTINIHNPSDYPLTVWLVSREEKTSGLEVQLQGTEQMMRLGEEQDPDFTKGIRLRTNFDAGGVVSYEREGTRRNLTSSELKNYFNLMPLEDKTTSYRLYDVMVEVFEDEEQITYLTGTVVR